MSASDSLTVLVTHCGWLVGQQNCPQVLSQAGIAADLSSSGLYVIGGEGLRGGGLFLSRGAARAH